MAGTVAELLSNQLHGRNGAGLHLFQPELVVGGTTGPVI
jgi:hypothetical protein